MELNTDRQAAIAQMRAGLVSLRESAERLRVSIAELPPQEQPDPGVRLLFGADGVLESVQIDDETRSALTAPELLHKVTLAFATAPVPAAVTRRLVNDPEALRALRDRRVGAEPVTHSSADGAVTLTTVLGRPVEVNGSEGAMLSRPTEDISASIVSLARRAADEEGTVTS